MRQKSKPDMLPHIDHLSNILSHRQHSVEHYCGKQQVNHFHRSMYSIFIGIS
jgi:hypothetical protein